MTLIVEQAGPVLRLRLNRPDVLNALDQDMADALLAACQSAAQDSSLRALLISGEGRGFMAGGDIAQFAGEGAARRINAVIASLHATILLLAELPIPVVSFVHGAAAGAGVSLALAADIVLAAEDAKFVLAYSRLGTSPDGGSTFALPRAIGLRRALGFALLEETIEAAEAQRIGLVNRVLPAATAEADAVRLTERLAMGPTAVFGRTKALLRASSGRDLKSQLEAERASFLASSFAPDFAEGVAAFLAKRRPDFRGE